MRGLVDVAPDWWDGGGWGAGVGGGSAGAKNEYVVPSSCMPLTPARPTYACAHTQPNRKVARSSHHDSQSLQLGRGGSPREREGHSDEAEALGVVYQVQGGGGGGH